MSGFKEFYKGKAVLLTGVTGFLGKVILEKMLRSLPTIRVIYVMIRPRANQSIKDRLWSQVFTSEIFNTVFSENPDLRKNLSDKVVPIAGDLIIEKLGLAPDDLNLLQSDLDVIINCAASVNFDDPLLDAIQINYMGCLRMLELAKSCHKLEVHVHVSTAYVNSNLKGYIEEKIYENENGEDAEDIVARLQRMDPQEINDNEK